MTGSRTLVLGIGNPVRTDDGVGVHVTLRLGQRPLPPDVDVAEAGACGLSILDLVTGYRRLILVDAIDVGRAPGTVIDLTLDDLEANAPLHLANPHDTDLVTALSTGRRLGLELPGEIRIVAVQIEDAQTLSESCTPRVAEAIGEACHRVLDLIALSGG
jgi:hydrogenase maturation protease